MIESKAQVMASSQCSTKEKTTNSTTIILLIVMLSTGCNTMTPFIATLPDSDIIVPEHRKGTLHIKNGCTYLLTSTIRFTIIWPSGSRWNDKQIAVVAPNGEILHEGDQIVARGGDGSIQYFLKQRDLYSKLRKCGKPYHIANKVRGG